MLSSQVCSWLADHSLCVSRLHLPHKGVFPCLQGSQPSRWGSRRIKHRPAVYKYVVFFIGLHRLRSPSSCCNISFEKLSSLPPTSHPTSPSCISTNQGHRKLGCLPYACVTVFVLEGSLLLDFDRLTWQLLFWWSLD